jgi:hemerythrin
VQAKESGTGRPGIPSMGNPDIDSEHRNFMALVDKLNAEIADQQRDKARVVAILESMLEDAVTHFAHEERLFKERAYPKREAHTLRHAELLEFLKKQLRDIRKTEFSRLWVEAGLAIEDGLVQHILNEDTQYIDYIRPA